jgi:hypothetical protein
VRRRSGSGSGSGGCGERMEYKKGIVVGGYDRSLRSTRWISDGMSFPAVSHYVSYPERSDTA